MVPPLLSIFNRLKIDRRAVACIITFGLTATYMILPVGFGKIFIESVLVKNINLAGAPLGLQTSVGEVSFAMLIPVIGMILGLLTAVFVTYRKPREYVVRILNLFKLPQVRSPLSPLLPPSFSQALQLLVV